MNQETSPAAAHLADQLEKEADEITCYASTTAEHRPNKTAALLREAAKIIRLNVTLPSGPNGAAVLPGRLAHPVYAGTYTAGWNDYIDAVMRVGPRKEGDGGSDYVKGWNACHAAHHATLNTESK